MASVAGMKMRQSSQPASTASMAKKYMCMSDW